MEGRGRDDSDDDASRPGKSESRSLGAGGQLWRRRRRRRRCCRQETVELHAAREGEREKGSGSRGDDTQKSKQQCGLIRKEDDSRDRAATQYGRSRLIAWHHRSNRNPRKNESQPLAASVSVQQKRQALARLLQLPNSHSHTPPHRSISVCLSICLSSFLSHGTFPIAASSMRALFYFISPSGHAH